MILVIGTGIAFISALVVMLLEESLGRRVRALVWVLVATVLGLLALNVFYSTDERLKNIDEDIQHQRERSKPAKGDDYVIDF